MAIRRRSGMGIPTGDISGLFSWIFWLALLAGGGYGVFYAIGALNKKAESEAEKNAPKAMDRYKKDQAAAGTTKPRKDVNAYVPRQVGAEMDRAGAEVNLLILAKEAARYKGDSTAQMEYARSLTAARSRLQALAARDPNVPETLEGNDEVLGIDESDFTKLPSTMAASKITQTISRIPANTFLRVRVRRGGERDVILYFGTASGTGVALAHPGFVKISSEFALEIQKQVLTLPPEKITDDERRRVEGILGRGEASDEEYAMLMQKLTGAAADAGKTEARESFARQIAKLQGMLPKAPVPEAIVMKDERRFTGKLLQETPAAVSVRTAVGDITVAKDDVKFIVAANDLRAEFTSKYNAGEKFAESLQQLLGWTQDNGMPVHRELVAYTILQKNPMDPFARGAAGYVQMDGSWQLKSSIASGAPIPERKAETKADIQRELESMGFVLRNNKWYSKVPWSTGMDSLQKGGSVRIAHNGTQVFDWHEADTPLYRTDEKMKKLTGPMDLKFIAPTQINGSVTILVEAPGEIVECSLRATGAILEAKSGGRIECFLTAENSKSEVIYDINAKADYNFHDVTALVRNKRKFTVTAKMTTVKDSYHTYARFLPTNKDSTQAFWVKGTVLKPASEFDRLWSDAR